MFVVTEADATAIIRAAFDRGGELAAAVELRRLFPGITDNTRAGGMCQSYLRLEAAYFTGRQPVTR